jgi:predicted transcriptional regulator
MSMLSCFTFARSTIKFVASFELLHVNIWGPFLVATFDGFSYFHTIVNDYTRCTWTHLMKNKSKLLLLIKNFLSMIEI